jgi:predicted anti-sigma-YlaC factor YlaD
MLECKEVMDLLSTYLSGKLEPAQSQQVRLHLKACKSCPRVTNICGTWVLEERSRRPRRRAATAPAA